MRLTKISARKRAGKVSLIAQYKTAEGKKARFSLGPAVEPAKVPALIEAACKAAVTLKEVQQIGRI